MDQYIGLDGHSQSCTLRVLTAAGKEVGRQVVETNGAALVQAVRAIPGSKHLCLEEGAQSSWLYELLQSEVDEIVVTVPARRMDCKDDARDALELAEGLRTGAIKRRVYKRCGPYSELRAAVRNYTILTRGCRQDEEPVESALSLASDPAAWRKCTSPPSTNDGRGCSRRHNESRHESSISSWSA